MRQLFLALCLSVLGVSCGDATQVMVLLDADPCLRDLVVRLEVTVSGPDGPEHSQSIAIGSAQEHEFPFSIPIIPKGDDASRFYILDARIFGEGDVPLGEIRHQGVFVQDEFVEVSLTVGRNVGGGVSGRRPTVVRPPDFTTSTAGWTDVPGSMIEIEPASENDAWLLLLSAEIQGDSNFRPPGSGFRLVRRPESGTDEVRSFVTGVSGAHSGSWASVDWVVGGGRQTYRVQALADPERVSIRQLRVIAVPVSGTAGLAGSEGPAVSKPFGRRWAELIRVCAPDDGDYLLLGAVTATELDVDDPADDAGASVFLRISAGEESWPENAFTNGREPIRSHFFARRVVGGTPFVMEVQTGGEATVATVLNPRLALVRAADLVGLDSTLQEAVGLIGERTPVSTLTSSAGGRAFVTIQGGAFSLPPETEARQESQHIFEIGDEEATQRLFHISGGRLSMTRIDLLESPSPITITHDVAPADRTMPTDVDVTEAFAHILHF